jgi:hypothetical protein
MTANIWLLLQPVDQEKLPAPMSHFDSPAEAPAPRGKNKSEIGPAIGKTAYDPTRHPTELKLKTQKTTSAKRAIFYFLRAVRPSSAGSSLPLSERPLSKADIQ